MEDSLEHMARTLADSGQYRIMRRLASQTEYHSADNIPKLVAAIVDVETTGTNPDRDKIIELGICSFEYDRHDGRIYKVLGSLEWFEDPGFSIPPEITNITGITDEMVAGHRIDDRAVNDLLGRVVLVIAITPPSIVASWKNGFPPSPPSIGRAVVPISIGSPRTTVPRRLNSWPMRSVSSMTDIGPRFFWQPSICLPNRSPKTGRLALQALLEKARLPIWRLWARDSAIETKDLLKNGGYAWSPGEFARPRCWYRDVSDADKAAEVTWLRANVIEPDQAVSALRITARDRYSDRCWGWGEPLAEAAVKILDEDSSQQAACIVTQNP
jgi:DNA polymerase III subunit epsilon